MGSKSNTWENDLLDMLFINSTVPNVGDAQGLRGSATTGNLYVSLHTADPGDAGDQTTNEISYTGYARKAVVRNDLTGWEQLGGVMKNMSSLEFPKMTGGAGGTVTHFGVGTSSSGAGKLLYHGAFAAGRQIANGITLRIGAEELGVTEE